jgi:PEP-CTERM motif
MFISINLPNIGKALAISVCFTLLQSSNVVAGTIRMFDGVPENVTGFVLSPDLVSRGSTTFCQHQEECTVILRPPSGFSGGASFQGRLNILEPSGSIISDILTVTPTFDTNFLVQFFTIIFTSDDETGAGLVGPPSNIIREDGSMQHASFIDWFTPAGGLLQRDEILFQSDVDHVVPEPATVALVGLALVGLGMSRRKNT